MKSNLDLLKQFFGISDKDKCKKSDSTNRISDQPFYIPVKEEQKTENKKKISGDHRKEFIRIFRQLTYTHHGWDVWRDFVIMTSCAFSNAVDKRYFDDREKMYMRAIKKYNKQDQKLFPDLLANMVLALEKNPEQDFLGSIFMELNLGSSEHGQFFTPYHICDFMAKICEDDICEKVDEYGYATMYDCCCGAGATLIAGVHEAKRQLEKTGLNYQNHVLVVAQDIDEVAGMMCYIQLSLLGVAGYVKIGNTLTDPISENDDKSAYWYTPMYFSNVWTMRRLISSLKEE